MFKSILVPTDGSESSQKSVREAIRLAKSLNAKVTGLSVMPLQHAFFGEVVLPAEAIEAAEAQCRQLASSYLAMIEQAAKEAGVACETFYEKTDHPYEAIIQKAKQLNCDLIMMASHGRKGFRALLLGSETQKVLTHSKIPVLVYR
jgi:nucleotide-binding universal stress UspA family protein